MKPFKVLSQETLVKHQFCHIDQQLVELPDGSNADWFISRNPDAVIVIPRLTDGRILLQKQYKHGGGQVVTEFCAGLVDPGEKPKDAAVRELREETGGTAQKIIHLHTVFANPTSSQMRYHYFLAEDVELNQPPKPEPAEQIELIFARDLSHAKAILLHPKTQTTAGMLGILSLVAA